MSCWGNLQLIKIKNYFKEFYQSYCQQELLLMFQILCPSLSTGLWFRTLLLHLTQTDVAFQNVVVVVVVVEHQHLKSTKNYCQTRNRQKRRLNYHYGKYKIKGKQIHSFCVSFDWIESEKKILKIRNTINTKNDHIIPVSC